MRKVSIILAVIFLNTLYSFNLVSKDAQVKGWFLAGSKTDSYKIGIEVDKERNGKVAYIKSKIEEVEGFGTIMQTFSAKNYLGKKVKLTGYIKTRNIKGWVGMWMRVDGDGKKRPLSFDNMNDRRIEGTTSWTKYEIILEVPLKSITINYGVLLRGGGIAYLDDLSFEIVESGTLSTGRELKDEPTNASFED